MIGYYVHHHGSGHVKRMMTLADHLDSQVTVLSSLPAPKGWAGEWVVLAPDDLAAAPVDPTAHGTLHWAPLYDGGLRARMNQVTEWIDRVRPSLFVVDVSVEVAILVRLTGTPLVIVAMPGDRRDGPHQIAYDLADALLAPWSEHLGLGPSGDGRLTKTWHVGAFSRFDGRIRTAGTAPDGSVRRSALLLWGAGGIENLDALVDEARSATPGWSWSVAGPGRWLDEDDLWQELRTADVVITHAGQNAVAEVAAAAAPSVVIASPRPYDEQVHTVRAISRAGIAVGLEGWPEPDCWPHLLARAQDLGGQGWRRWAPGDGAQRAAACLDELVAHLRHQHTTAAWPA